jgi:hypothetical protein
MALLIGVVVAVAVTAVADAGGSARKSTGSPTTSIASRSTSVASTVPPPTTARSVATTTVVTAPPTTASRPVVTTVALPATKPVSRLVPLRIAPSSHEDTYNRDVDFGGFADVNGCENTRAELLIRTSRVPVTYTTARDCTVKTGLWTDPWSGRTTAVAHDLQIDHTVPLANAWRSGAWAWTHDQRVAYANDLTDPDHLVAIISSENESKGDDGPDAWKPPNRASWCRYALAWDHIESKWHLSATRAEWNAMLVLAATC